MTKKHLVKKAKELYVTDNFSPEEIAEKLGICRRTVFYWLKKFDWRKYKARIEDYENNSAEEAKDNAQRLIWKINKDWDEGRKISNLELRTVAKLADNFLEFKKNESSQKKAFKKLQEWKDLLPDF